MRRGRSGERRAHADRGRRSARRMAWVTGIVAVLLLLLVLWKASAPQETARTTSEPSAAARPPPSFPTPRRERVAIESTPEVAPAPEPTIDAPQAPAAPDLTEIIVRDVWNDAPVPGITFALTGDADDAALDHVGARRDAASGAWELTSDAEGVLRVPFGAELGAARPGDSGWRHVVTSAGDDGSRTAWVHATLTVRGEIRARAGGGDAPDLRGVRIDAIAFGEDRYPGMAAGTAQAAGRDEAWLTRNRLATFEGIAGPAEDGTFVARIPRVPSLMLIAFPPRREGQSRSEWRSASARITRGTYASLSGDVQMVLQRGLDVAGVVRDETGQTVAGARVTLHVVVEMSEEDVTPSNLRQYGHGYGATGDLRTGRWLVDFQISATSDGEGRFAMTSNVDGAATLWVEPSTDHRVTSTAIGPLSSVETGAEHPLTLQRVAPDRRIRLFDADKGAPLTAPRAALVDVTDGPVQQGVTLDVATDGTVPARWLRAGRRYTVFPRASGGAPLGRHLRGVWDGGDELRLAGDD